MDIWAMEQNRTYQALTLETFHIYGMEEGTCMFTLLALPSCFSLHVGRGCTVAHRNDQEKCFSELLVLPKCLSLPDFCVSLPMSSLTGVTSELSHVSRWACFEAVPLPTCKWAFPKPFSLYVTIPEPRTLLYTFNKRHICCVISPGYRKPCFPRLKQHFFFFPHWIQMKHYQKTLSIGQGRMSHPTCPEVRPNCMD